MDRIDPFINLKITESVLDLKQRSCDLDDGLVSSETNIKTYL